MKTWTLTTVLAIVLCAIALFVTSSILGGSNWLYSPDPAWQFFRDCLATLIGAGVGVPIALWVHDRTTLIAEQARLQVIYRSLILCLQRIIRDIDELQLQLLDRLWSAPSTTLDIETVEGIRGQLLQLEYDEMIVEKLGEITSGLRRINSGVLLIHRVIGITRLGADADSSATIELAERMSRYTETFNAFRSFLDQIRVKQTILNETEVTYLYEKVQILEFASPLNHRNESVKQEPDDSVRTGCENLIATLKAIVGSR